MNYCKKCSRILDNSDATICPYCGEPLEGDSSAQETIIETTTVDSESEAFDELEEKPLAEVKPVEPLEPDYETPTEAVTPDIVEVEPKAPEAAAPEVDLDSKLDEINKRIADNKNSGTDSIPPVTPPFSGTSAIPQSATYAGATNVPPSSSYGSTPPSPPAYGSTPTPTPASYGGTPTSTPPPCSSAPRGTGYSAYSPPPPPSNGTYGAQPPRYAPAPAPADNSPTGIGYLILAIFMPIIGLIVGVVMMNDVTPKKKRDGKNVLYISLIQIGFFVLMCCCLFALASSGSDLLYDLFY